MHVADAVQRVNRDMAHDRDVRFEVLDWKTHARPRVDEQGPQGPIDKDMPVGECDIVVGIFWNRFGTPIPEMGGQTGTEHEIRTAIAAWRKSGKPEVVVCFNDAPFKPRTVDESEQVTQVLRFRFSDELRGLELAYDGPNDFRDKIRDYLGQYLKAHYPVTPGHVTNGKVLPAVAGDPTRYIKALREETS